MKIDEIFLKSLNEKLTPSDKAYFLRAALHENDSLLKISIAEGFHVNLWLEHVSKRDVLTIVALVKKNLSNFLSMGMNQIFVNSKTVESALFLRKVCKSWAPEQLKGAALISGAVAVDIVGLEKALKLWSAKNKKRVPTADFSNATSLRYSFNVKKSFNSFAYLIPGVSLESLCTLEFSNSKEIVEKMFSDSNLELVSTFFASRSSEGLTLAEHCKKWGGSLCVNEKAKDIDQIVSTLMILNSSHEIWGLSLNRKELQSFSQKSRVFITDERYPLDTIIPRIDKISTESQLTIEGSLSTLLQKRLTIEEVSRVSESSPSIDYNNSKVPNAVYKNEAACAILTEIVVQKGFEKVLETLQVGEDIWLSQYEARNKLLLKTPNPLAVTLLLNEVLEADDDTPVEWTIYSSEHLQAAREKIDPPTEEEKDRVFTEIMDHLNSLGAN